MKSEYCISISRVDLENRPHTGPHTNGPYSQLCGRCQFKA